MKISVHLRLDGGVTITHYSKELVGVMTDAGYGWGIEQISYEVNKFVLSGKSIEIVQPYIEAMANGGVTELEAITLIQNMINPSDCIRCIILEDTDLPNDMDFRDAWEWKDN